MKIVFIGSSKFGLRCLEFLNLLKCCTVTGAITAPSKFKISYKPEGVTNVLYADIPHYCLKNEIPHETINCGMNDSGLLEKVREWRPDAYIVSGWYHMIPKSWRDVAPAYGLHASLLPDYSGGAPLVWAMINGENKTGITLFQMDGGVDSGPIVGQIEERIYTQDTIASLYERIENRGLELLDVFIPKLSTGSIEPKIQDESKRRIFPQRTPEDGKIDWSLDALSIERFIRAQTRPYPGAFTIVDGERLIIWEGEMISCTGKQPEVGTITFSDGFFHVICGKNKIKIKKINFKGLEYEETSLRDVFGGRCINKFKNAL